MNFLRAAVLSLLLGSGIHGASAEPVTLDVVLTTSKDISLAFKNDKQHFLTLLLREGRASGVGTFEGAQVAEYGMHDVTGGVGGEASGYIEVTTTGGDTAYFRWHLKAVFVAGADGKTRVANGGTWELAGGTGHFAGQKGVGSLRIEFPSKTERRYLLEGDISPQP